MLEVSADAQGQSTSQLVGLERGDIEHECQNAVAEQGEDNSRGEVAFCGEVGEACDFSGAVCVDEGLCGGKGGHAQEQFEGGELQAASQEAVGCDSLLDIWSVERNMARACGQKSLP